MSVPKKKVSFKRILDLIKSIDRQSNVFLLWDSTKKKTIKERILKLTMTRPIFLFIILSISTLIVTKFQLISIIFCCSFGASLFGAFATVFIYIYNKDIIKDLLKWCENLYDIEKKYPKLIQTIAESNLMTIERKTIKYLRLNKIACYIDAAGCTLGITIIGIFLPENIYPKFSPPLPFYLPFKNQKTWLAYGSTTLLQTFIVVNASIIAIFIVDLGIIIFTHVLGYLDIIEGVVEKMKQDMLANIKTDHDGEDDTKAESSKNESKKQPTLKLETLAVINSTLMESQNDSLSFDEWIEVLHEMICDVNYKIISVAKVYSFPILINELAGLGSLFICGLLFTVVREQYLFAVGITVVCCWLFIFCYINEKILEKFENINEALYDIPWFDLTLKQKKSLMILMNCDKIQGGLTAAGIHNLTLERFGIIVKAGYTNMLVLKDLVQK